MSQKPDSIGVSFLRSPQGKGNTSKLFLEYRKKFALLILRPTNIVVAILWLWFAIKIDPLLHPGFLELHYGHIALFAISSIALLLSYLPYLKKHGLVLLFITYFSMLTFYSFICGRLVNDPIYFSGLQIIVVVSMFIPASLITVSAFYLISLVVFFFSLSIYHPYLLSMQEYYMMYNLAIAYLIGGVGFFIINRYQFNLFMNQLKLEEMATIDVLTQVSNRRYFLNIMEREFQQSKRYKKQISLMIIDLDYFKKINDTYGHTVGDYVLMEFAKICSREIRKTDMIGRLGGEEFAVMLPNTDVENARILAERIRKAVDHAIFEYQAVRIHLTVSIGLASFPLVDANDPHELIIKADEFLYLAKEKGRNRVCWQMKE
ncbi:MAG: GGDEF domain-containing protein [Smithella sp.]|jgi:diguanylate cyclase (GGDEF)-like protein